MQLIEQRIKFQLRIITKFLNDLLTAFSPYRAKLHRCKDIFSHWQCRQFRIIYYFRPGQLFFPWGHMRIRKYYGGPDRKTELKSA